MRLPMTIAAALLAAPMAAGCIHVDAHSPSIGLGACEGERMVETRLYLGMASPNGPVSEDAFRVFVESEVTPRWREGYTILSGEGLWYSEQRRVTEREPSRVLVRLHDGSPAATQGIEAIRAAYISRFTQDAVLRTDAAACADF
jgi:hypothetical protein